MDDSDLPKLAERWLAMWNGDLAVLPTLVDERIVAHVVAPDGRRLDRLEGRAALGAMIRQVHACFSERTVYELGPIIQDPYFVVRWWSTGTYDGGIPEVPAEAVGKAIDWRGIDIVRVERGVVVEFWMSADTTVLMSQLRSAG